MHKTIVLLAILDIHKNLVPTCGLWALCSKCRHSINTDASQMLELLLANDILAETLNALLEGMEHVVRVDG